MSKSLCALTAILLLFANGSLCIARNKIEADPSKRYELTKIRGPWMISVATFHSMSPDGKTHKGKSPEEAAHELIIEMRQLGMPAYMYIHDPDRERVSVSDALGREEYKKNLRRVRSVLVIAGNYQEISGNSREAKRAQESLKWVKNLNPKCLREGVVFEASKARPTPFSRAFLTFNPLLTPEEIEQLKQDPLLVQLNSGVNYSLYDNPGEYTLVIARFTGDAVMQTSTELKPTKKIMSLGIFHQPHDLNDEGESAMELVTVLRGQFHRDNQGNLTEFNDLDAYVWHRRSDSIVTVGSFKSRNDPRIERFMKMFGPRWEVFADGSRNFQPGYLSLSGFGKKRNEQRLWLFDPDPQLMRVPKRK